MGEFVTAEAARERFRELADQVDAAYAQMRELSSDAVGNPFRVEMTEHLEASADPQPACPRLARCRAGAVQRPETASPSQRRHPVAERHRREVGGLGIDAACPTMA